MLSGFIHTSHLSSVFHLMGVPCPALPAPNDRCVIAAAAAQPMICAYIKTVVEVENEQLDAVRVHLHLSPILYLPSHGSTAPCPPHAQ